MEKILKNKKVIIASVIALILIVVISFITIRNEKQYKLLASELTEVGVTNYNHDDLIVKNSTIKNMNKLLDTTTNDLNSKLTDLLSQCDTLKLTCTSEGTLIDQANFAIQTLASKLNEVITAAAKLNLDTTSIISSDDTYVNKINLINTNIDNENKRLAEVAATEKAKEEEQAAVQDTPTTPTSSDNSNSSNSASSSNSSGSNSSNKSHAPYCPYSSKAEGEAYGEASGRGYITWDCGDGTWDVQLYDACDDCHPDGWVDPNSIFT